MRGLVTFTALVALLRAAAADAGTLFIAVPAKAAPCDFEQIAAALHAQLPGVVIVPGIGQTAGQARGGDVTLAFSTGSDSWELTVAAPGEKELRREIPAPGSECGALAETSALIVERYLESIAWSPEPAVVTPLPPPPPPIPWQLAVSLGAGGYLGRDLPAPLGALEVGVRHGRWQLTAGLAAPFLGGAFGEVNLTSTALEPVDEPTNGTLQEWLYAVDLALTYRWPLPVGILAIGVEPGVELVREVPSAPTTPLPSSTPPLPLFGAATSLAASPDLGLSAAFELPLSNRFYLGIRLRGRVMAIQTTFSAPGENGTLVTSRVDGDATLGVTAVLF
jgi:hypothetical protein